MRRIGDGMPVSKRQNWGMAELVTSREILGCSRHTIERGLKDLERLPDDDAAGQVRRPGAGRKPQTANRKPQTANRKPQTANRKPKTEDRRPKQSPN
jgi:hypothetical protein